MFILYEIYSFQCVALLRRGTQSHAAQHLPNIYHATIPIIYSIYSASTTQDVLQIYVSFSA